MPLKILLITITLAILPMMGCHAEVTEHQYLKEGLSFMYPKSWVVSEEAQYPGTQRSVSIETPGTALMTIEFYTKENLMAFPEYQQYDTSLLQFAKRYDGRDITSKLQIKTPVKHAFIHRQGYKGLKETRRFQIGDVVNKTMISEFYRMNTKDQIIFITVTAPKAEWPATIAGFDTILKTLKYH